MVDDRNRSGPMAAWPEVGAQEILQSLRPHNRLIAATSAEASSARRACRPLPRELVDRLEQLLADEALRTHPVVGQVLEGGARRLYVRLRVTELRVVDVRAR